MLHSVLCDFDVCILHLVRHPIEVIESFGDLTKKDDQGYKGYISANVYYFLINLFCWLVGLKVGRRRYLKIRYEDFLLNPKKTLGKIALRFDIDLQRAVVELKARKRILEDKVRK